MSKAPPSKKKLKKAREEGKVNKSQILTRSLVAFSVLLPLTLIIPSVWVRNRILLEYIVVEGARDPGGSLRLIGEMFFTIAGGSLLLAACVSIVVEFLQVGFHLTPLKISPQFSRLNPVSGASRILDGIRQLWLVPVKLAFVVAVLGIVLFRELHEIGRHLLIEGGEMGIDWIQSSLIRVLFAGLFSLLVAGVFEYCWNRYRLRKELTMSPDEIRREHKEEEGDPHIKSHRRAQHQALSMQAMVQRIRKAKVIVVEKM